MRVSEALDLLLSDIHGDGLLIRKTKFQKTRLVPLHETAVKGLRRYLACRRRLHPGGIVLERVLDLARDEMQWIATELEQPKRRERHANGRVRTRIQHTYA
jgi:integrase